MLRFTLRGIHAKAMLPRLATVEEPPEIDAPAIESASQSEPKISSHFETETPSHFETANTKEEELRENDNNGPELSLSVFQPPEEPEPDPPIQPDPRIAKVVAEIVDYIPEATPEMVNLAICDFTVEYVERAVVAFESITVRSNAWACFLGILRNFKRQGGPAHIAQPAIQPPTAPAKPGAAEPDATPMTDAEIAALIATAREPGPSGEYARVALNLGIKSGQIEANVVLSFSEPVNENRPGSLSPNVLPDRPELSSLAVPLYTTVQEGTAKTRQQRAREDSNLQPSDSKSEGRTDKYSLADHGHVPRESAVSRAGGDRPSDCKSADQSYPTLAPVVPVYLNRPRE